jgi:Uma2 family endonuclease
LQCKNLGLPAIGIADGGESDKLRPIMSIAAQPTEFITTEEYLEGERVSETRHEYVDGHVYAMAGASDDHNRITANLCGELRERLRGQRCEPFATDMKVKIPPSYADVYYYPDVLVACDPTDNAKYHRDRPSIIFEVISPDTERVDRREKNIVYRAIPSLTTYVIVEQARPLLTVHRRTETGWQTEVLEGRNAVLKLPAIGVEIPLERIYERTTVLPSSPST